MVSTLGKENQPNGSTEREMEDHWKEPESDLRFVVKGHSTKQKMESLSFSHVVLQ
jgi:hypothetical protein